MVSFSHSAALSVVFAALSTLVAAIPAWDSFATRDAIGTLVPGATFVQALSPTGPGPIVNYLGSTTGTGLDGSVITRSDEAPTMFFVDPRGDLYQSINDTTILRVNVLNTTSPEIVKRKQSRDSFPAQDILRLHDDTPGPPLKLVLGKKPDGITSGKWRWQGTMLIYELPSMHSFAGGRVRGTNQGLFYQCKDMAGAYGLYMFLEPTQTPPDCSMTTLHSFGGIPRGATL